MKKLFFSWFLFLFTCNCIAQVSITNKGITITNSNQNIYVNGNIANETAGLIQNTGNIYVNGNISNNGTTSFCDSSNGSFYLNGTHQVISGTHALNFHRVILNTPDTLELQQSVKITDSLDFSSGYINLNGNTIDLDTTGTLSNERQASHVYGTTGKILFRKYIAQPSLTEDFGGLGLAFKSTKNFGVVTIERSHIQQAAADSGIFRCYKVTSQYPNSIDSISLNYFYNEQFRNEVNYKVFSKKTSGTNGWLNRNGTVDIVRKGVSTKSNLYIDTTLFTIADETCSLSPDINIMGISTLTPLMTIDTITCTNDTLSINAFSSAPNAVIIWKDMLDSTHSNPLQVSSPDFFSINAVNGINGCASNVMVNIAQNKTGPALNALQDSVFLNCSTNTMPLNGGSVTPQTQLHWTGPNNFSSANPATVTTPGNYFITGTRADNGCSATDSVFVGYKPVLVLKSNNDTLVCKNSAINLHASVSGSVSGVNYLWNNGASSANTIIHPTATTTYIVSANSPGCSGKDTVLVTVSPDIIDSVESFLSCNGTKTGTILLHSQGGIPPYLYSINSGTTFSSTGTFSNLPFGNYSTLIKDSLGCTKANSVTLNGFSSLPIPKFIASTQNAKGDTIVLVDISSPQPDSVSWIFPPQVSIIGGDKFNPVIYTPDTGAFKVTMIGFWGDCIIDTTKLIYFHATDTSLASEFNNNGIKSVTLYPSPNNGSFTVGVEFYKKQNSSIQIWDATPTKYLQKNFSNADLINLPISLGQAVNGIYILRVIGEYNTKYLNFVVSH
jgi:hypothetical protein